MKCDSGQDGCQPCQSKGLPCFVTDRQDKITRQRGQTSRLENEIADLKRRIHAYEQRFGPLNDAQYSLPGAYQGYPQSNGYNRYSFQLSAFPHFFIVAHFVSGSNQAHHQQVPVPDHYTDVETAGQGVFSGPHKGPIHETTIDFIDGEIDIAAFACPDMADRLNLYQSTIPINNSRRSSLNTMLGAQRRERPQMPPRDDALMYIDMYLNVIAPYVPIVHGPTFRQQVDTFFLRGLARSC
jgi:hypothetical protein